MTHQIHNFPHPDNTTLRIITVKNVNGVQHRWKLPYTDSQIARDKAAAKSGELSTQKGIKVPRRRKRSRSDAYFEKIADKRNRK